MGQVDVSLSQPAVARSALRRSRCLLSQASIIIPIGPQDEAWRSLIDDLTDVDLDAELLFVAARDEPADFAELAARVGPRSCVRWIATVAGRAHQMNLGAERSVRPVLWFLHADSRVGVHALVALRRALETHPDALHYFNLTFQNDGPRLARLNSLGVQIRSRILGLPFGDQALCLSRDTFERLGGFNEQVAYGEDHLLVWTAHRRRVPLRCVGATITTSARRYRANGWLSTTLLHGWRTWRQALPEFCKLLWSRIQ